MQHKVNKRCKSWLSARDFTVFGGGEDLEKNFNFWDEKVEKYLKSVPDYSGI